MKIGKLVFARKEQALFVAQIHDAIYDAHENGRTWDEFWRAMPLGEYEGITADYERYADEPFPSGTETFDPELLPGWSDGDYPRWLEQEQQFVLPGDILRQYGRRQMSVINGDYVEIDEKHLDAILAKLLERGWSVEDGRNLRIC